MLSLAYAICILIPISLVAAGHWFPWPTAIGRKLRRIETYCIGMLIILTPPTVVILTTHEYINSLHALALVWVSCLSAGAATVAAWGIDALISYIHSLRDQVDREHYDRP